MSEHIKCTNQIQRQPTFIRDIQIREILSTFFLLAFLKFFDVYFLLLHLIDCILWFLKENILLKTEILWGH